MITKFNNILNLRKLWPIAATVMAAIIIQSCKEDDVTPPVVATLTTAQVGSIASTTAISGGEISSNGGGKIIARGVCWSTTSNPTIDGSKTSDGTGTGSYISSLTNLKPATLYYVRAYATNSVGTAYGNEVSFTTGATLPTVTTIAPTASTITNNSAKAGGEITNEGGAAITVHGVVLHTANDPSELSFSTSGGSTGEFTISLVQALAPNTTYFLRAFATNSVGTAYGEQVTFTTSDVVTDIDGNEYGVVQIGDKVWMQENLRVTRFSNGDAIPTTSPVTLDISGEAEPKYQWIYDNNNNILVHFGRLYTGYVAADARNVCPTGWHVPSNTEMANMNAALGGGSNNGDKLRRTEDFYWANINNMNATNESGFFATGSGMRTVSNGFSDIQLTARYWTTYHSDDAGAYWSVTAEHENGFGAYSGTYKYGLAIRCVKD
jgi:uncharacterized protein (TIGR02145 family)